MVDCGREDGEEKGQIAEVRRCGMGVACVCSNICAAGRGSRSARVAAGVAENDGSRESPRVSSGAADEECCFTKNPAITATLPYPMHVLLTLCPIARGQVVVSHVCHIHWALCFPGCCMEMKRIGSGSRYSHSNPTTETQRVEAHRKHYII